MTDRLRARLLPALTVTLLLLAAGALGGAALVAGSDAPAVAVPASPASTDPAPSTNPAPATDAAGRDAASVVGERPIAELVDPEFLARTAAAGDLPPRALAAYAGATVAVAERYPACGLGWNTLAAIGWVESEHGTLGGGRIGADGVATPPIVGVALNGDGVAAIADTDGGELDGDPTWDRAVGPLQFLPATWQRYAQDGDLDGRTDIHDVDDAALAAAVLLCEAGGDLTVPENWIAAVGAYNAGAEYNNRVAAAATRYGSL